MSALVLVAATLLAVTFAVALVGKGQDLPGFTHSLATFGLPRAVHRPMALVTLAAEGLALVGLLVASLRLAAVLCLLLLLLAFTLVSAYTILRGRRAQCRCFGNLTSGEIGPLTLLRNAGLALLTVPLLTESRSLPDVSRSAGADTLVISGLALAIAGLLGVVLTLLRRYGEALHTLDAVGVDSVTRQPRRGLASGTTLPDLTVQTTGARAVSLTAEVARHRARSIVILSTTCGHCTELLPTLRGTHGDADRGIVLVQASHHDDTDRYRDLAGAWQVLFSDSADLADTFHIAGYPALVPLDERGDVKGATLLGRQGVETFLNGRTLSAQETARTMEGHHAGPNRANHQSAEHAVGND